MRVYRHQITVTIISEKRGTRGFEEDIADALKNGASAMEVVAYRMPKSITTSFVVPSAPAEDAPARRWQRWLTQHIVKLHTAT
jgi:hypothetical protein